MHVTIITASTGRASLLRCIESVQNQSYKDLDHLIFADGPQTHLAVNWAVGKAPNTSVISLPYSVGEDRFNGHRMYFAGTALAKGDLLLFLDDDNYLEPEHVESLVSIIKRGNDWAYSYRKILDKDGRYVCLDDCESLVDYPSICGDTDYFCDVNCFALLKHVAVTVAPVWYRKFREPGQMEVDRALTLILRTHFPKHQGTGQYTLSYATGGSPLSVQPEFFLQGNDLMLQKRNGVLPWKK